MSRAACSASVASSACSEPTCLWASPLRLRMKTSHNGVFGVAILTSLFGSLQARPSPALLGMGRRGLAHPRARFMRLAPRRQTFAVAGAVAGQHLVEFFPVDRAVLPVSRRVLLHAGIGDGEPEEPRLRHRRIDEFLS